MQTVVRILPRGQITIPNRIRKNFQLGENSVLEIEQVKEGILLKPIAGGQFIKTDYDYKRIRQSWERFQEDIGQALEKIVKTPKGKRPFLFR